MYSADDGYINDFHLAHLGTFAMKGAGSIFIEATAVEPRGRISQHDLGLWEDGQIAPLKRVVDFIKSQGSVPGIQLAHAGRKASMGSPFYGYVVVPEQDGGWADDVVGPSDIPFDEHHAKPRALTIGEMMEIKQKWVDATIRADKAGIEILQVHSAHG
jgi:2,4-dienoyl-CoA reductase-like NADH-dependent reductase (Old Yellow Enzyme family)